MDETTGNHGSPSLWDSREDAEAASAAVGRQVEKIVRGMLIPSIFEAYGPAG